MRAPYGMMFLKIAFQPPSQANHFFGILNSSATWFSIRKLVLFVYFEGSQVGGRQPLFCAPVHQLAVYSDPIASYWEPSGGSQKMLECLLPQRFGQMISWNPFPSLPNASWQGVLGTFFGVQIPPQQVFGSLGVDLRICFKQGRVFESTSRFVSFDGLSGWVATHWSGKQNLLKSVTYRRQIWKLLTFRDLSFAYIVKSSLDGE